MISGHFPATHNDAESSAVSSLGILRFEGVGDVLILESTGKVTVRHGDNTTTFTADRFLVQRLINELMEDAA